MHRHILATVQLFFPKANIYFAMAGLLTYTFLSWSSLLIKESDEDDLKIFKLVLTAAGTVWDFHPSSLFINCIEPIAIQK
jgi:hypothetical protein